MSESGFKELPVISAGPLVYNPSEQDPIIGIDLGTTNSLVAIIDRAQGRSEPEVILTLEGQRLLPSVVHFTKTAGVEVGYGAFGKKTSDPENTIYSAKRLLGRGSKDVESIRSHLSFNVTDDESNILIKVQNRTLTPIEISSYILKELKKAAEAHLGRNVEDAVITVPAYFNDSQRQATRAAGKLAGLNVLRILNEPTAASLAYGLQKRKNGYIAVYDLGGGTFDISILRLRNGVFEVLATGGDTQLGGDDMDELVSEWIAKKLDSKQFPKVLLRELAEKAKKKLSTEFEATIEIAGKKITLTRQDFEEAIFPLLERTKKPTIQAIKDSGIGIQDITDVVLVGGPTRLECVQVYAERLFGKKPNCSLHPDEAVALGAAVQADILAGNNKDFLLLDVVPLSLGIETFGGAMNKIISRNTRVPALAKEQFTTYVDGQTKVAINVFQGERELVAENRKLGEFVLKGVPPLPAGVARVEVSFLVDADGILNVSAREIYSEVEASIEVKPTYGLTDADVEKLLEDGLMNQEKDREQAQLIEAKNDALTILQATEKSLTRVGETLTSNEVRAIQDLISHLKNAINSNDLTQIKTAHKNLNEGTLHLAEVLMSQTVEKDLKNSKVKNILK